MKAYSLDLRQKIIEHQQEAVSQRQIAKRFGVATSFTIKLLKQYRETGSMEPKPHAGGTAQFNAQHQQVKEESRGSG